MKSSNRVRSGALGAAACLSLACSLALAPSAHADASADSDRANLLFKKGKVAFNEGKYDDALRIYSEAWRLKQSPDIAANLAQTESELGKHRDAAEHFSFALAHLLPSTTDEQKKALADGLEQEKKEVGTLRVTLEPADSVLTLDDAPVALPPSGELFVTPGEHHCSVTHEGYQTTTEAVQLSKGSSQVLWIKLAPVGGGAKGEASAPAAPSGASSDQPPEFDHASHRPLVPVIVGAGVVAVGAAVGVGFMLSANSSQDDANRIKAGLTGSNPCGTGTPYGPECNALHDKNSSIDSARRVEVVGFSVAGAAAIGTALYLLWPHTDAATARAVSPALAVGPGGGSIGLRGRF